jgi:predicted DCC family thiol-disulfide oxidoreductase YuxK
MRGDEETVVLYDRDCSLCVWSVQVLRAWDRRSRVAAIPIQGEEGSRLLARVASAARLASMHVVTSDGAVRSGGAGLPAVLRPRPGGRALARLTEVMPRTTDRAYRLVSRHRATLGRRLGRRSCPAGAPAR